MVELMVVIVVQGKEDTLRSAFIEIDKDGSAWTQKRLPTPGPGWLQDYYTKSLHYHACWILTARAVDTQSSKGPSTVTRGSPGQGCLTDSPIALISTPVEVLVCALP
jgi:hypothetical protein